VDPAVHGAIPRDGAEASPEPLDDVFVLIVAERLLLSEAEGLLDDPDESVRPLLDHAVFSLWRRFQNGHEGPQIEIIFHGILTFCAVVGFIQAEPTEVARCRKSPDQPSTGSR
jgi:hypothetical protein